MNTEKYGLLLRVYSKNKEDVNKTVNRAIKNIQLAIDANCFSEILVLIPSDYDCGETSSQLKSKLSELNQRYIINITSAFGHHSCEALNRAIERFHPTINKVAIVSGKAIPYITKQTMLAVNEAFKKGAAVVGVATAELEKFVLSGRVQNTFAIWSLPEFLLLGGFKTEIGVEEIDPLVGLVQKYGKCIAILDPEEKPELNIRKSADGITRHNEVMKTKLECQQIEVDRLGVNFSFIENGIMNGYPKKI